MLYRPRRNRKSSAIRDMVEETYLSPKNLIYPLFLIDGKNIKKEVASMPGNFRWSLDLLLPEIEHLLKLGIDKIDLFPVVDERHKDKTAS
ncbi:MAG: porphobilinogen synthase, partial [Crocinitomicaceae bacterium]